MELRQLRYFIAVAECLNFSRAAEELHITVPPLSRQIKQLEEEFDTQLFVRNRRRVMLTDAGRLFLREAKTLAEQMTRFTNCVRQAKHGDAGTVRIAIGVHTGERLSRAVAEHAKQYPQVEIQTAGIFSPLQSAALVAGKIDVGFLRPPVDRVHLKCEALFEERLAALVNKANPLAKRRSLRLKDLAGETLLLEDRRVSAGLHDKTMELFARAGVSPQIVQLPADSLANDEVQKVLVAANRGICIVADESPAHMALGCAATAVPLDEPDATVEVHMAWRKSETSGAVLAFLESVRRVFGRTANGRAAEAAAAGSGTSG
jgi:LysR family transcriptional regulator, benzoate and cis,cis-muconate-responsive activator of ben and cat genes